MERRRVALSLAAILAVGFVLRLGFVLAQRDDVLFDQPVLDEAEYVGRARSLALGHGEDRPYWQPPGIVYAMAATMKVAGPGLLAPRILQVIVSVASLGLVFLIGRMLFGARVALVAAGICAVHGVLVFETYELLPATWIVFLDLLALWLLLRALARRTQTSALGGALDALLVGLALGVSAIFTPTVVPFVAVAAVLLRRPLSILAVVVGLLVPIVPVTLRNHAHGGEVVFVSTNGGLNLYLGNNEAYEATLGIRPGRHWEELTEEPVRAGARTPGERSTYFTRKALRFVADHPAEAAGLVARKLYLFVHGAEIPRDTDIYEARRSSWILAMLVWPRPIDVPDGLLIPVALVGIVALWRERRRLAAPLWLLATLAIMAAAFFVTSRHRAPAVPLFALFAAAGALPAWQAWRQWTPRRPALGATVVAVLVVGLNMPTWETRQSYAGELDFYRGIGAIDRRRLPEARAAFRRAVTENPRDARAWFELGNIVDGSDAIAAWRRAAELDPWDTRAARRAAGALVQAGDVDAAIAMLEAAIASAARSPEHYAADHLNLAFMESQRGKGSAALVHLDAAIRLDRDYARRMLPRMAQAAHREPATDAEFLRALDARLETLR